MVVEMSCTELGKIPRYAAVRNHMTFHDVIHTKFSSSGKDAITKEMRTRNEKTKPLCKKIKTLSIGAYANYIYKI